ncbi:unnamed protein product [Ranitomeya imitator]|uniref:Uncharacterized protein n=1 Tax=Ranitomeya imitator TaxID=111125 RepID=A0ABN9M6K3_9NEOB|nr:unnamed protein product [Ranitomeya imitator]
MSSRAAAVPVLRLSEDELRELLALKGSSYNGLLQRHNIHSENVEHVVQSLRSVSPAPEYALPSLLTHAWRGRPEHLRKCGSRSDDLGSAVIYAIACFLAGMKASTTGGGEEERLRRGDGAMGRRRHLRRRYRFILH